MRITVKTGLERYNEDAIEKAIKETDADRERRRKESDKEIEAACKDAASWLSDRARGKKFFIP
jgi:hypothetical protein